MGKKQFVNNNKAEGVSFPDEAERENKKYTSNVGIGANKIVRKIFSFAHSKSRMCRENNAEGIGVPGDAGKRFEASSTARKIKALGYCLSVDVTSWWNPKKITYQTLVVDQQNNPAKGRKPWVMGFLAPSPLPNCRNQRIWENYRIYVILCLIKYLFVWSNIITMYCMYWKYHKAKIAGKTFKCNHIMQIIMPWILLYYKMQSLANFIAKPWSATNKISVLLKHVWTLRGNSYSVIYLCGTNPYTSNRSRVKDKGFIGNKAKKNESREKVHSNGGSQGRQCYVYRYTYCHITREPGVWLSSLKDDSKLPIVNCMLRRDHTRGSNRCWQLRSIKNKIQLNNQVKDTQNNGSEIVRRKGPAEFVKNHDYLLGYTLY